MYTVIPICITCPCCVRGFDQQIAGKIGDYMEEHGVNFIKECVPTGLEQLEPPSPGKPGKIKVRISYFRTNSVAKPEPVEPKLFWDLELEPKINFNKHFLQSVLRMLG